VLLRSWIGQAGLADRTAWVSAGRDLRDPRQFWACVADALRGTTPGAGLVRPVTAAPDPDGWAAVERLLDDLGPLQERIWLVVDDLHELDCDTTLAQMELLVRRAPPRLRIVLAARHGRRLGLHQLRLEGELTELGEADLRFTPAEARALLAAAGARLADPALTSLVERTEGWAAGLRLAALSLAGHRDPERFAAEFCGSERTVAEYLLAEVLDRQSEQVRRLLLRTSVLERVNGELADLLTGDCGCERVLQELETANAFVVSVDAARSWFRCHRLFGDLLQLELRRTEPDAIGRLHRLAARWFADHGCTAEAARHAQAASGKPSSQDKVAVPFPRDEATAADHRLPEPLSPTEKRVLGYLPTNLPVPDIAREMCVSANTVKTHTRHLFTKLDAHSRAEAVTRARALGLLTPAPSGGIDTS
jgi:LuxR family maltose regulon positive regulatory protein